jgi:hypothetical protein
MGDYGGEMIFLPEMVGRWPRREALAWHRGDWADGEGDRAMDEAQGENGLVSASVRGQACDGKADALTKKEIKV